MNNSKWTPIFTFDIQSQVHISGNDQEIGWIKSWPNPFSIDVIIVTVDGEKIVPFHWDYRFNGFAEFLDTCHEVFRISIMLIDNDISMYRLDVNSEMFKYYIEKEGCIPGEMYIISLIREKIKSCQECGGSDCKSYSEENPANFSDLIRCDGIWNNNVPLTEYQNTSVQWMQHIERSIKRKTNQIQYATCIPIGKTDWAYDCTSEAFTKWENTAWLKTRFRGAVLTNHVNTGKTACALYLIASHKQSPTTQPHIELNRTDRVTHETGTLIIVPQNIIGQWSNEILKFLNTDKLKISFLSEPRDLKRVSFLDILSSDIIITTTNFMKTKGYVDCIETLYKETFGHDIDRKVQRDPHVLQMVNRKICKSKITPNFPFIELIHWHRIIVDEIHEFFTGSSISRDRHKYLKNISCDIWWGLTGTPNTRTSESMQSFYFFLAPKLCDDAQQYHNHPCLQSAVKENLLKAFASSTKEPLHHLHSIVPTPKEIKMLEKLCDFSLENYIMNSVTLPLQAVLFNKMNEKSAQELYMMKHSRFNNVMSISQQTRIDSFLVSKCTPSVSFLKEQLRLLASVPNVCTVCMDNICNTILICGHSFCENCIGRFLAINTTGSNCPTCRYPIDRHDIVHLSSDFMPSIGTKLFEISKLVVNLLKISESVVLFVQWKQSEEALTCALKTFGIDPLRLCGTVTSRNAILKRFIDEPGNALILLLDQSSAGLHLSSARHAVFVHAIVEHKNSAYEQQAIGRLSLRHGSDHPVHIHHFVLENTREYDNWIKTHSGNTIQ